MRLVALSLLPVLALASSLLPVRQAPRATITSLTSEGPACPPSSIGTTISTDGTVANVIFSTFRADYEAGVTPPGERDLDCRVIFKLNLPIGCTSFVPSTRYHGFVGITQGGVTGDVEPSYVLSPGQLTGVNTSPTRFDSASVKDFIREDAPTAKVTIRNANEQTVTFESRTRMRVITNSDQVQGAVWMDALDINLKNQLSC